MRGTTRSRGGSSSRRESRRHQGLQQVAPTTDTPPRLGANHAAATLLERLVPSDPDLREVDVVLHGQGGRIEESDGRFDALLRADSQTWDRVLRDLPSGLSAFGRGQLEIRNNLHLGVNFLASTSGSRDPARLRFETIQTK